MDRTTDLEIALSFVVHRIEEQAKASHQPLNEEEYSLLKNLPPSNVSHMVWGPGLGPPELVPRNIPLERICGLAKTAYLNDRKINPELLDWEFAFGVFRLSRHPMWGVLHSAGIKMRRRALWDQLFLIIAALVPVIAVILLPGNGPQTLSQWAGILCGSVVIMLLIYFASRQIERRQLENHVERCRLASQKMVWKTS
jgi:hypothetical protein